MNYTTGRYYYYKSFSLDQIPNLSEQENEYPLFKMAAIITLQHSVKFLPLSRKLHQQVWFKENILGDTLILPETNPKHQNDLADRPYMGEIYIFAKQFL